MSEDKEREADREPHCAHPRDVFDFTGHDEAEHALADALASGRMHHAWLIAGPKGLGKATLAYRLARAALGAKRGGKRPLDVSQDDPIARRIAARSHPDLFVLKRAMGDRGKLKRDISAEDARGLGSFFSLAPAEGGMRVAIVDAVDDLNAHSANAILKTLEEPPPRCVLLLVCHAQGAALATIRSRCRRLPLRPLDDAQMQTALGGEAPATLLKLAKGRPGRAIALRAQGLEKLGDGLEKSFARLGRGEARAVLTALYGELAGEPVEKFAALAEIMSDWVRANALETRAESWAEAWSALETLRAEAEGLDMDPRAALMRLSALIDRAGAAQR